MLPPPPPSSFSSNFCRICCEENVGNRSGKDFPSPSFLLGAKRTEWNKMWRNSTIIWGKGICRVLTILQKSKTCSSPKKSFKNWRNLYIGPSLRLGRALLLLPSSPSKKSFSTPPIFPIFEEAYQHEATATMAENENLFSFHLLSSRG